MGWRAVRKVFVEWDVAGAEWVIVAYLSRDPNMLEVVRSGVSPHTATASFATKVPVKLILKEEELLEGCIDPEEIEATRRAEYPEVFELAAFLPTGKTLRQTFKTANHSLNYGLGYKAFALRNEISEAEGQKIHTLYHEEAYPCVQKVFQAGVRDEIRRTGALVNCFGRRREFLGEPGPELWLDAYAHIPQSTVFDLTRLAMVHVYHQEPEAELISQDHDAITAQLPPDPELIAGVVGRVKRVLSHPLVYGGESFTLGNDAKMGLSRAKRGMVKVSDDPAQVSEALARLGSEA